LKTEESAVANPLHEHESWLDSMDAKLFVKRKYIVGPRVMIIDFAERIEIPISRLSTEGEIIRQGRFLKPSLSICGGYLVERFVKLACTANQLDFNRENLTRRIITEYHKAPLR
jgi:hypothetical protein